MNNEDKFNQKLGSVLFTVVILLQCVFFLTLILNGKIPDAHDAFDSFIKQYYFLNNAAIFYEIPQWSPYFVHGTTATWWYSIQGVFNPLTLFLLPISFLLKAINFFYIYHAGMFIDELILLVGTWALANRYFKSPLTVFFVTVSVLGSSIWISQPFFNFYFYFTLPLIIFLLHRFFDNAKGMYLLAACTVFSIQVISGQTYVIPLSSLCISLYFIFYFLVNKAHRINFLKTFHWNRSILLNVLGIALIMLVTGVLLYFGKDNGNMYMYNNERNPTDGSVPLSMFLTYNAKTGGFEWLDLILRFSSGVDFTLYIGYLALPFCLMSLFCFQNKSYRVILYLIGIMLLFTASSFVSVFFYYVWPLMKFIRHLSLVAPMIKIFVCFAAGFGFDYVITNTLKTYHSRLLCYISVLFMVSLGFYLYNFTATAENIHAFMQTFYQSGLLLHVKHFQSLTNIQQHFYQSLLILFLSILAIVAMMSISHHKLKIYILMSILSLHVIDLYFYKTFEFSQRTMTLSKNEMSFFNFIKPEYRPRRTDVNARVEPREVLLDKVDKGIISSYATFYLFTFTDKLSKPYITYNWQKPFNQYLKAFNHEDISDNRIPNNNYLKGPRVLTFPMSHQAQLKISGYLEDKIQFFNSAIAISNDSTIANCLTNPEYHGDQLFISSLQSNNSHENCDKMNFLMSTRRYLPYSIESFSSNHIKILVNNTENELMWMFYSDVWHPQWKATINNKSQKIYKADLAYKAVRLHEGMNVVHLSFMDLKLTIAQLIISIASGVIILGVLMFVSLMIFRPYSVRLKTFLGHEAL